MSSIWDSVEAKWVVVTMPDDEDYEQYVLERDIVPSQLLKFIAGYENGPRQWLWPKFPYKSAVNFLPVYCFLRLTSTELGRN